MKETGILFTPDNIRKIIADEKWQTRRVLKDADFHGCLTGDCPHEKQTECDVCLIEWAKNECSYGSPGDHLYVKEAWALSGTRLVDPCLNYKADGAQRPINKHKGNHDLWYPYGSNKPITSEELMKPDLGKLGWRSALFMPKWAARIWLEIIDIRIERVQDISAPDAIAEGISKTEYWKPKEVEGKPFEEKWWDDYEFWQRYPQIAYHNLWNSINGKTHPWSTNPWVWAISFRKI